MKLAPAGIGGVLTKSDRWSGRTVLRAWVRIPVAAVVIAGLVFGAIYGITKAVRASGAASCRTFSRQSGYGSTYRIQHFLDAGTCYVHLPNGHQLPEKNIAGFIKANG